MNRKKGFGSGFRRRLRPPAGLDAAPGGVDENLLVTTASGPCSLDVFGLDFRRDSTHTPISLRWFRAPEGVGTSRSVKENRDSSRGKPPNRLQNNPGRWMSCRLLYHQKRRVCSVRPVSRGALRTPCLHSALFQRRIYRKSEARSTPRGESAPGASGSKTPDARLSARMRSSVCRSGS